MQDLFYLLLGVAVIVLPIYFIVKVIKNKGKKEKNVKEKAILRNQELISQKRKVLAKYLLLYLVVQLV